MARKRLIKARSGTLAELSQSVNSWAPAEIGYITDERKAVVALADGSLMIPATEEGIGDADNTVGLVWRGADSSSADTLVGSEVFYSNNGDMWIAGLGKLTSFNAADNYAGGHMDFRGAKSLATLSCIGNALTTLDVSGCTSLTSLSCYNNQLTT